MDARYSEHHPRAVTPADVVAEARRCIGIPYRHQGRNEHALDCVGLIILVARRLDLITAPITKNYGRLPTVDLIAEARRLCSLAAAAEAGGILLITWPGETSPAHAALVTAGPHGLNMIHADRHHGRVVEHGYRAPWPRWTDSAWRLPGVAYG